VASIAVRAGIKEDRYGQPGSIMESDLISGAYSRRDVEIDANTDNSIPYATTESYYLKVTPAFYVGDTVTIKADITKEHKEPKSANYWAITWPPPRTISNKVDHEKDKFGVLPQVVVENRLGSSADNKLTFGYDKYVYELTSHSNNWIYGTATLDAWYYQDIERDQYAYYIHDALMLFDRVVLNGGYRYEKSTFTSDFEDNNSAYLSTRHSFDQEAAEIGVTCLLGGGSNVYYNYNKGFRYPKSDEFMSLMTGVVNEQLIPQQSDHHQLGVNYRFNNRLKFGLCLFRLDTTDEIYYDANVYQNLNYNGKIRRDGVETGFSLKALDWLTFKGSYTRTEAGFESGTYDGNVFPGVPKHTYDFSTFIDCEHFSAWASLHGVSESYFISDWDNRIQGEKRKLSGFTVLDVKASYKYGDFEVFTGINNVLDKEYEEYAVEGSNNDTWVYEPAYYPSPERNFFAGITYTY
jgi:outer membrane receptor for monomeric catechols